MEQKEEMRENEEMRIFAQKWYHGHKWIITIGGSSVQLDIYPKAQRPYDVKAFIYRLWVDEESRGQGIGRRLLQMPEEIARAAGERTVHLEWISYDSPRWVYDWYLRNRYHEVTSNYDNTVLMLRKCL